MSEASRDLIGDEDFDDDQDRELDSDSIWLDVTSPEALSLAAVVLAALSLAGLGLLNGPPYVPALYSEPGLQRSLAVTASLLGVGLALLPAALGAVALRRLPVGSPCRAIAGAAVLLALLSVLLRLAVAVRTAAEDAVQFVQF